MTLMKQLKKAEKWALEYSNELGEVVEYIKFCSEDHAAESKIVNTTEIYSMITKSDLEATGYLSTRYNTGGELIQKTK